MLKKFYTIFILLIALVSFSGCGKLSTAINNNVDSKDEKIKIVVSFNPLAEFTKAIGGDKVQVDTIIPAGTEPHEFEPKAKDLANISKAKLFIYNGLDMEPWVDKSIEAINNKDLNVVEASKGCSVIKISDEEKHKHGENDAHNHGAYDPHTWLSLSEAKVEAKNIKDALVKIDSKNKEFYEKNYKEFSSNLDLMLVEYKGKFSSVKNKNFVTGHEAFGYLCRDFNLKQESIESIFAEGEPTPKKMQELVQFCKKNNVTTIFVEDMVSPKVSETLAKEINAKVQKISTIENKEENKTYLQVMKENLDKIYESIK